MSLKMTWLVAVLALTSGLPLAIGQLGYFSEVHMGMEADTRLLSVTVVTRELALWRLWPEEVKVGNALGKMEYHFKYSSNYSLTNAVRAVASNPQIPVPCQKEMAPLLVAPTARVAEERRTVTVTVPVEPKEAMRITLRASDGLEITDVRQLRRLSISTASETIALDAMTHFLYVQLGYKATYSVDLGPSDLATVYEAESGELRISPLKAGFALLRDFAGIGRITPGCWANINERYSGSPLEPSTTANLNNKKAFVAFAIPEHARRTIHIKPSPGLTVETVEQLE